MGALRSPTQPLSGPGGTRTLTPVAGKRILSPLRLPIPPRAQSPDSTGLTAESEAVSDGEYTRLGGLLGAAGETDSDLQRLLETWPGLPEAVRKAFVAAAEAAAGRPR